jgi:hypothetical protein
MRTGVHPLLTVHEDLAVIGPTYGDRRAPAGAAARQPQDIYDPP